MALEYAISHDNSLIRVVASGTPDYKSISELWHDIVARCKRHDCRKVLGESCTEQWLDSYAYDHATIFRAAGLSKQSQIAWVENNRDAKDSVKLTEAVIRNRGYRNARVFDSIRDASRWLAAEPNS